MLFVRHTLFGLIVSTPSGIHLLSFPPLPQAISLQYVNPTVPFHPVPASLLRLLHLSTRLLLLHLILHNLPLTPLPLPRPLLHQLSLLLLLPLLLPLLLLLLLLLQLILLLLLPPLPLFPLLLPLLLSPL